jgi:hypothetical protein
MVRQITNDAQTRGVFMFCVTIKIDCFLCIDTCAILFNFSGRGIEYNYVYDLIHSLSYNSSVSCVNSSIKIFDFFIHSVQIFCRSVEMKTVTA